jgi:hypothetical protein
MVGMIHLALLDGGQTNLLLNSDNSNRAQTTLTFGEDGPFRMPSQSDAVPRWLTILVLIPRKTLLESRRLNHVVVVA